MAWMQRLLGSFCPRQLRREIDDELRYHLERRLEDQLAAGLATPEARRAARQRFGDVDRIQERTRDMDILTWLETWLQDLKQAARMMRRAPGFTMIVVLSLALGIGANAAIFSLVNAVLLQTLPVPAPNQIFSLTETDGVNTAAVFSYPILRQLERTAGGEAAFGASSSPDTMPLAQASGASIPVTSELISGGYFSTLGITPVRGRWIDDNDNRALGASPVAVISYGLWMRQFGGSADIVGRNITLRGVGLTVVGIAPRGFSGLDPAQAVDLWTPLMMQPALHAKGNRMSMDGNDDQPWAPQEGEFWLQVFARLRQPGRAAGLAAALSPPVAASFHRLNASHTLPYRVTLAPYGQGGDRLRREYGAPLRALMVMVGLMLLIAVANVATLLLARMVRRRREIAIRLAVGISRARLARQLLTEGLLLALLAGLAALGVAVAASRFIVRLAADPFRPDLDWRVWVFLAGIALASGLCLGLLPAWQAQHGNPADALKAGELQSGTARGRVPLGRWLVIAQVAFSLLLVASAALFSRSLAAMFTVNLGFDRAHILTARLSLPDTGVPVAELGILDQQLLNRLGALPSVRAVALDQSGLDDYSTDTSGISLAGRGDPPGGLHSNENTVSRNFFSAVGMPLVRGRGFQPTDTATGPEVVVVNQAFARRFYSSQNPLGQTFGYDPESTGKFHIIGIVADARVQDPHQVAVPLFYRLLDQSGNPALTLEIRSAGGDPAALTAAVRAGIAAAAPQLRVGAISSVSHRLDAMLQRDRLVAQLSGGFGGLALALACLGLYGVMAYSVAARRTEFGIRLALGGSQGHILGLVLREALLLVGGGLALGLPLALWAGRALQPLLPGVAADDPVALAAAVAVMAGLPLIACLRPAWRAARVDPAQTLRAS